ELLPRLSIALRRAPERQIRSRILTFAPRKSAAGPHRRAIAGEADHQTCRLHERPLAPVRTAKDPLVDGQIESAVGGAVELPSTMPLGGRVDECPRNSSVGGPPKAIRLRSE